MNSDIYLVKRATSGERGAFDQIVESNKKKIFYLAYDLTGSKQDAEDLSQEVFLKAYRGLNTFKGEATLSSWLYRITLNAYLDRKKKRSFKAEKEQRTLEDYEGNVTPFDSNSPPLSVHMAPENYAESEQIQAHIDEALEQLSPKERTVFVMRHYKGMPGKRVGQLLNISEGTVKSLLFRAIKKLQRILSHYNTTTNTTTGSRDREVYQ
ncbi:MAG: RNA polymerase sigma factor [bacterium]|nr:RNA polymerase sigma factor [bacterium]